MKPKVYIIIVTYNAMRWVERCMQSIKTSAFKAEVVVIDNCSKDETVNYLREKWPQVKLIVNSENRGFGQANNQGIEYAYKQGSTHFFLLNQDAYLYEDTIGRLVAVQDKYNIALVSPIHLNGDGTMMDYNFFEKIVLREKNIKYVSDLELGQVDEYYPVFKINAAAWMLSRRAVEEIGGFDPIYFHYGEDGNYCQRLKYHGEKCVFVPKAYVHHDRILQGNMKVYKQQQIIMHLLYSYTDVNSKPLKITKDRIVLHCWHIKLAFASLFKLDFTSFSNVMNGYWKFFGKLGQISKSIKTNKTKGHSWLKLS